MGGSKVSVMAMVTVMSAASTAAVAAAVAAAMAAAMPVAMALEVVAAVDHLLGRLLPFGTSSSRAAVLVVYCFVCVLSCCFMSCFV